MFWHSKPGSCGPNQQSTTEEAEYSGLHQSCDTHHRGHFFVVYFLDGGHSDCGEMVSQSSFNLHSSDTLIEMMIAQLRETRWTLGDLSGGVTMKHSGWGILGLKGVVRVKEPGRGGWIMGEEKRENEICIRTAHTNLLLCKIILKLIFKLIII